jgi:DNA-directed RNA polymerase sigma subunit (sigma70/sigma32)
MKKRNAVDAAAEDTQNVIHVSFAAAVEAALQNLEPHRIRLLSQVEGVLDSQLDRQAKRLLEERFGFSEPEPKSVTEIADERGLTPEQVQAMEIAALRALRGHARNHAHSPHDSAPQGGDDGSTSSHVSPELDLKALANKLLVLKGGQS